jgi:hypothetical protein
MDKPKSQNQQDGATAAMAFAGAMNAARNLDGQAMLDAVSAANSAAIAAGIDPAKVGLN